MNRICNLLMQVITGNKTFHCVKASVDVITSSTVNNRQPLDFTLNATIFGDPRTITSYSLNTFSFHMYSLNYLLF